MLKYLNESKKLVNPEWIKLEKVYQRELSKLNRLYNYIWIEEKSNPAGRIVEVMTPEYERLKSQWEPRFNGPNQS